jgi:hypothetical protein
MEKKIKLDSLFTHFISLDLHGYTHATLKSMSMIQQHSYKF